MPACSERSEGPLLPLRPLCSFSVPSVLNLLSYQSRAYNASMHHPNLLIVHAYPTRPEAELAVSALEAADIPAMIQADTVGGMREHLAWSGAGFKIFVREEDLDAAREVLAPPDEANENPGGNLEDNGGSEPTRRRFT